MTYDPFAEDREEKPKRKPGRMCPLFRKDVSKVCHTCDWWRAVPVWNKETNITELRYACAQNLAWIMARDLGFETNAVYGVMESMREETVDRQDLLLDVTARSSPAGGQALADAIARKLEHKEQRKALTNGHKPA